MTATRVGGIAIVTADPRRVPGGYEPQKTTAGPDKHRACEFDD